MQTALKKGIDDRDRTFKVQFDQDFRSRTDLLKVTYGHEQRLQRGHEDLQVLVVIWPMGFPSSTSNLFSAAERFFQNPRWRGVGIWNL